MNNDSSEDKEWSFFKKFFNDKGSMISVIVVAVVFTIGLIGFGINQISFAAEEQGVNALGETVSKREIVGAIFEVNGNVIKDNIMPFSGFYTISDEALIGIEYDAFDAVGQNYVKKLEVDDPGLVYLINNVYPKKEIANKTYMSLPNDVQLWLSQAAVWTYLYEIGDVKNKTVDFAVDIRNVNSLSYNDGSSKSLIVGCITGTDTLFDLYGLNALISKAKEYHKKEYVKLDITKNSNNTSITKDDKYYQTDLISILSGTNDLVREFKGYSIDLSKAPVGTILVDEAGQQYEDTTNMSPTAKFYVRVPVDKITNENKQVQLSITGNFSVIGAYTYESADYQKVVRVENINKLVNKSLDVNINNISEVLDAGMSVVQTLYFIGLILLLSGIGIVYVNIEKKDNKKKKSK